MSPLKLYLDEDAMRRSLVFALRARNVDVLTAAEAAMFSARRPHAGIIVARQQQHSVGEELRRLMRLISSRTAEQMRNRVEFLSSWS